MPLRIYPPIPGRSPHYRIRGTYLRVRVDRSARTGEKAVARKVLKQIQEEIERGEFTPAGALTFFQAATSYMQAGGESRFMPRVIAHLGMISVENIDQDSVVEAAKKIFPPGISEQPTPLNATIDRQIFTPVSAVLKHAKRKIMFSRPKRPKTVPRWIEPSEAKTWLEGCSPQLRRLTVFLLYTGCRLGDALDLIGRNLSLSRKMAFIPTTKNGEPRAVHLPKPVLDEMKGLTFEPEESVFQYRNRWHVYDEWTPLKDRLKFPDWWTPHACCHTWATWMRQYAGMDLRGLLGTGRWKDIHSVLIYQHVDSSAESRAADLLPDVLGQNSGKENMVSKKSVA